MLIQALNEQQKVILSHYDESTGQAIRTEYQASVANSHYHIDVGESDIADIRIIVTNNASANVPEIAVGNLADVISAIMPENLARVNDCLENGQDGYHTFELVFKSEDAQSAYSRVYDVPDADGRRVDFRQ